MEAKFLHKFNPINKSLVQYNLGRLSEVTLHSQPIQSQILLEKLFSQWGNQFKRSFRKGSLSYTGMNFLLEFERSAKTIFSYI